MKDFFLPLEATNKIIDNIGYKSFYLSSFDKLDIPSTSKIFISDEFFNDYVSNDCSLDLEKLENIIHKVSETSKSNLQSPDKPLILAIKPSKTNDILKINSVLNIGFNSETVEQLGNFYLRPRFAYESYYLFVCNFLKEVYNVSKIQIENIENRFIESKKIKDFKSLKLNDIKELIEILLNFAKQNKFIIPESIYEQCGMVIESIYTKWISREFKEQKIKENFSLNKGIPLIIEEMTFGNLGENSGSFTVYSRDPSTGEKGLKGDYFRCQQNHRSFKFNKDFEDITNLESDFLDSIAENIDALEKHLKFDLCVQGVIEDGQIRFVNLYEIPKTIHAEVKICNDFIKEEKLDFSKAINFINSEKLHLYQNLECQSSITDFSFTKGRMLSKGSCVGKLVFDEQDAKNLIMDSQNFIIFSKPNQSWDSEILKRASGIILDNKQFTSRLAERSRELCIPAIAIDDFLFVKNKQIVFENQKILKSNEQITLDASSGRIFKTKKNLIPNENLAPLKELIIECKKNLNFEFLSYAAHKKEDDELFETCIWDSEKILKNCISDLDKLKILFKTITPRELIKIKNNLRDSLEQELKNLKQEKVQVFFPSDIINTLIPGVDSILDFVEISKLDYNYVQTEIIKLIDSSKNSISGSKVFIENESLFALILQSFLEAMWRVQNSKEIYYTFVISNINNPAEYLYFKELISNGIQKLCPEINLELGITITNSSGVLNYDRLSKITDLIIIDLDVLRSNYYGFPGKTSIAQDMTDYKIWNNNFFKDFSDDLGEFISTFVKANENCKLGIKNDRAYKNNFKKFLLQNHFDYVICNNKWKLNAIVNLVNTKT